MTFKALPARNHPICSSLKLCAQENSSVEPSGLVSEHRTGRPGANDARSSTLTTSSSPTSS